MTAATRIEALVPKGDFLHAAEVAHLCAGGVTPVLRSHAAAIERLSWPFCPSEAGSWHACARFATESARID
jgi:hypothetical protein